MNFVCNLQLWHYGFILFICDNCLLLDADMLISVQMASLATYFGLGQQTHRYFYRLQGVTLLALALK